MAEDDRPKSRHSSLGRGLRLQKRTKVYVILGIVLSIPVSLYTSNILDVEPADSQVIRIALALAPFILFTLMLWFLHRHKKDRDSSR